MIWRRDRAGNGTGPIAVREGGAPHDPWEPVAKRLQSLQVLVAAAALIALGSAALVTRLGCAATSEDVAATVRAHAEAPAHAGSARRLAELDVRCATIEERLRYLVGAIDWQTRALWSHVQRDGGSIMPAPPQPPPPAPTIP